MNSCRSKYDRVPLRTDEPDTKYRTDASLKAVKLTRNGDVKVDKQPKLDEVLDEDDEEEAGPELPPEEDDGVQDDEEGRFFGGGITNDTATFLDFMEQQEDGEVRGWLIESSPESNTCKIEKLTSSGFEKEH